MSKSIGSAWVDVLDCVSATGGGAALIGGDRVRGQCSAAVERRQRGTSLPSGVGTFHRSGHGVARRFGFVCDLSFLIWFYTHKGRNVETVEVPGDRDYYTLSRLQPDVEYIVTIIPMYEGNTEGPGAPARFKIGRCYTPKCHHKPKASNWVIWWKEYCNEWHPGSCNGRKWRQTHNSCVSVWLWWIILTQHEAEVRPGRVNVYLYTRGWKRFVCPDTESNPQYVNIQMSRCSAHLTD